MVDNWWSRQRDSIRRAPLSQKLILALMVAFICGGCTYLACLLSVGLMLSSG